MINYNGKCFRPISNSVNGNVSKEMIFRYFQTGNVLTCNYSGEKIQYGSLLALVSPDGTLDMRYHQLNDSGELMTGICTSTPEFLTDGRIRLHEKWQWTSGDKTPGESLLEEIVSA